MKIQIKPYCSLPDIIGQWGIQLIMLHKCKFVGLFMGFKSFIEQKEIHTAIIRAILREFCESQRDFANKTGFSIDTVKSWSCGRRVPSFETVKKILVIYNIIDE